MSNRYDHAKIEKKWQKLWEKAGVFHASEGTPSKKYYSLETFPYPSAAGLHVGHPEGYTAEDINVRYQRMRGKNVLYTMGWDAFGLPTENYAIKIGKNPKEVAKANIANFKRQVQMFGFSYDWTREINTSDPAYYRWTQWFFLQLYKHGLAYRGVAPVNWCDSCKTVLANEQVKEGRCERCDNLVAMRDMEQWFFKITKYAEELLAGLDKVDWPDSTKEGQRNWIGKSEGALLNFPLSIKRHFVLLHGYQGNVTSNFLPWLKQELEAQGHTVDAFDLPSPDAPVEDEWVQTALEKGQFDQNTILFGYSLGAVTALKVLEHLKKPIAGTVLAGGFLDPHFKDGVRSAIDAWSWKFDFDTIKKMSGSVTVVSDLNDPIISREQGYALRDRLRGTLVEVEAEETHFDAAREPSLLQTLLPGIRVFTTRPDTLFGATYMVLAPEHKLVDQWKSSIKNWKEVEAYRKKTGSKSQLERTELSKEKTGVELKGVFVTNPATNKPIPVWIADYVLASYGTGAIMAVPAHDERDFEFAKKFKLPIVLVIAPSGMDRSCREEESEICKDGAYVGSGVLINSGQFDGMDWKKAKEKITKSVGGEMTTTYRLRDWLVSRQRYWGAPIPIVYDPEGQPHAVKEEHLPWLLPTDVDFKPTGLPPLASSKELIKRTEKLYGKGWRPEVETMDTFVDSSWYYYRYTDPLNTKEFANKKKIHAWLPTDLYIIGAEHTALHLLYARFFTKVLHELGYTDFDEPFSKLRHIGLILGEDGRKMSKRWGNVVNPDDVVGTYGADAVRLYEMFMGQLQDEKPWNTRSILGVRRFIERVWSLSERVGKGVMSENAIKTLHQTIKKVTEDIEGLKYNTAIAQMMVLVNEWSKEKVVSRGVWETFLKVLCPFTPHVAEELWERLGNKPFLSQAKWPVWDEKFLQEDTVTIAVQVNGKVRAEITQPRGADRIAMEHAAKEDGRILKWTSGKKIVKVIVVPDRLVNIVVVEK
ncbi:MAG: leucine--tRNA ligase [bacterium]|nr:leucine--tRNA ligase [bacterium]